MAGFNTLAKILTFGKAGNKRPDGVVAPGPVGTGDPLGRTRRTRPPGAPADGTAIGRSDLAATQVAATNPPSAAAAESANTAAALAAAQRTRRRAAMAGSGLVGGVASPSQAGITTGGTPRRLLGY